MNEYLVSAIIYLGFLIASFFIARAAMVIKSAWYSFFLIVLYFALICLYFELLNTANQVLRNHGIYIEFGHASLLLVMVFFGCVITALLVTLFVVLKRINKKAFKQLI
jgi:hypothetical protein